MISILCSRPKCLAVLLVLALAPATASAAKAKSKKKRASTPAAQTAPAPEAAPAPPPAAPAPDPAPPASSTQLSPAPKVFSNSPALGGGVGALDFSGLLALDIPTESAASIGPRLTGEAMYNIMDLAPQLRLAAGARMSFAYHGFDPNGSFWLIDAVPDAKIKFALNDSFALYGDVGMGLSFQHVSQEFTFLGVTQSASDSTLTFTFQFGAGAAYAITPSLNLLAEARFDLYTRSGAVHSIAVPTVGVQWHP